MKTKIMATFAILIIALSIVGIVYAHWIDSVVIKGTASMGSITFGFTSLIDEWDSEDYLGYPLEKQTGTAHCYLKQPVEDTHTGHTVYKLLEFNITGGYGEYWGINKFTLDNAGTVPLKIQNITVTVPVGFDLVVSIPGVEWDVKNHTTGNLVYEIWLYNETSDVDYIRSLGPGYAMEPPWLLEEDLWWYLGAFLGTINGTQIDKLDSIPTEMCVYLPETAQICHTYTFSIAIDAIQWNKWTP